MRAARHPPPRAKPQRGGRGTPGAPHLEVAADAGVERVEPQRRQRAVAYNLRAHRHRARHPPPWRARTVSPISVLKRPPG